jgi:TRAP-type C4-dicarboxylate transport system permease small subunit
VSDMEFKPDEFDDLLRRAMMSRPEASVAPNLAGRAIARATAPAVLPMRASRWRFLSSLAASLLIVGVLSYGGWRWYQSASTSDDTSTYTTDTSTTSSIDVISTHNATLLLLGGGVFIVALAMLTLDRLLVSDDPFRGGSLV